MNQLFKIILSVFAPSRLRESHVLVLLISAFSLQLSAFAQQTTQLYEVSTGERKRPTALIIPSASSDTFAAGSTLTLSGTFTGTPTGGTLNLSNLVLPGNLTFSGTLGMGGLLIGNSSITTTTADFGALTNFYLPVRADASAGAGSTWLSTTTVDRLKYRNAGNTTTYTLPTTADIGATIQAYDAALAALAAGSDFVKFSGPATSIKTFTLPDASATILTDNAAVTVAQGGTGRTTGTTAYGLIAAGTTATGAQQTLAAGATTDILVGGGASALPVWTTAQGSGAPVRATSPTLTTPNIGAATATSLNGNTFTTGTYTLTGTAAKTLNFTNTLTLSGTDSTTMTFPSTSAILARTDAANTFTGTQTFLNAITYGGVTLSAAVTGTGSMALSVAPTFTGKTSVSSLQIGGTMSIGTTPDATIGAYLIPSLPAGGSQGFVLGPTYTASANGQTFYGMNFSGAVVAKGTNTGLTYYHFFLGTDSVTGAGTIDNSYQLYIAAGTSATNKYGIYQVGTDPNVFAGKITISDATASSSTSTGSGIFSGGIGVAGAGYFGGLINSAGSVVVGTDLIKSAGSNGQAINLRSLTELTTIAAAATTDTAIQLPANAIILSVSVRVTTVIPTATTFSVGDSVSATRFSTANVAVAANSTDVGTKAGAYYNASATAVRLTMNGGTPAANTGRVRVTIAYIDVTVPTS